MNILSGHGKSQTIAQSLRDLSESLAGDELPDVYGEGDYLQDFERDVAEMFGKPAAVFMPSGTMAQQIALRIACESVNRYTVAMHPTSHLEFAEQLGYQFLHGIHRLQFGVPEFVADRLLTIADFEQLQAKPGVVLLELPSRPLGGQLPDWDGLVKIHDWCRDNNIRLHLDGARIWQCSEHYNKTLKKIGQLFDSVYVSFYKDLGGMCGCMLLGEEAFIDECRLWQRRYGGNLFTQAPFVASARVALAKRLPQLPDWNRRARELAAIFNQVDGVQTHPVVPHVNIFQLYLRGDAEALTKRHHKLAEETGTHLFSRLMPAPMPGYARTEIHVWENAMAFDESGLPDFLERLLNPRDGAAG